MSPACANLPGTTRPVTAPALTGNGGAWASCASGPAIHGSGKKALADKRVLILDDDALVGSTIAMMCEGCEARLSTDADSFFAIYDAWDPSYVVLDLSMPEMDGIEIMRAIKRRVYRAGIIIISGMGTRVIDAARDYAQARGLTIAGTLEKPIEAGALRAILESDIASRLSAARLPEPPPRVANGSDAELCQALEAGQIRPFYQPRVDASTGLLAGFEVEAHWEHPQLGALPPDRFFDQAARLGIVDQLTGCIANAALEWFAGFHVRGFGLTLSLSVPRNSLHSDMVLSLLRQRTDQLDLDRRRIIIEITEGAIMVDPGRAVETFTRLRAAGFGIAIDDFATGYYSLAQLFRLPVSELKIEESLVATMHTSRESRAIVKSIIDIAGNLDLRVSAEGVADSDSCRALRALGCEYLQGSFIASAMPAPAVSEWVEGWRGIPINSATADAHATR
jgi:EAL domain-containing protein (putative c-di-GMP-specific phosphodiesterase class I)/CheY-like chemotaxis protein